MPYQSLLLDTWSTDLAVVRDDAALLAQLIWGHIIHHFSTPGVFLTWDEDSPSRIQNMLVQVAVHYPAVKPSCAIRAMLVILSIKKTIKGGIAYALDAELLFQMAFKSLAARYTRSFTHAVFTVITNSFYVGSKMDRSPKYVEAYVVQSLSKKEKPLFDAKIASVVRYYLVPWFPGMTDEQLRVFAATVESPAMPSFSLRKPQGPSRVEQTLVFPDPRRQCFILLPCPRPSTECAVSWL